jgi:hypothetical protein
LEFSNFSSVHNGEYECRGMALASGAALTGFGGRTAKLAEAEDNVDSGKDTSQMIPYSD